MPTRRGGFSASGQPISDHQDNSVNDRLKEQNKAADAKEGDKLDWKMRAGGSSLGRCKTSGLTSAYSSYHRAGQGRGGREGGGVEKGRQRKIGRSREL